MIHNLGSNNKQFLQIELLNRNDITSFRKSEIVTKPTINSYVIEDRSKSTNKIGEFNYEFRLETMNETDRRMSHSSATSTTKKFKKNTKSPTQRRPAFITEIKQNYDIWDLTYTLIQSKMKPWISAIWFFTFLAIRVFTLCCCVYISLYSAHTQWLIPFLLVRVMFFILVIKISLNDPTTKTEIVLKTHWNSIENNTKEYFEVTSWKKLGISILRGLIPAELSFIYIKSQTLKKKYELFTAINFIFVSMQQIVFYPFFIIYSSFLVKEQTFSHDVSYEIATIVIISGGFLVFLILSGYLIVLGVRKKYGGIVYWYNMQRYRFRLNKMQYENIDHEDGRTVMD